MDTTEKAKMIDAAAECIHSLGFHKMADDFRRHPEYRERIIYNMARVMAKEHGHEKAFAFARMARLASGLRVSGVTVK